MEVVGKKRCWQNDYCQLLKLRSATLPICLKAEQKQTDGKKVDNEMQIFYLQM